MSHITRRGALTAGGTWLLGGAALGGASAGRSASTGRLKQSVCRWPFAKVPLPDFCKAVASLGLPAIDLLNEKEWRVAEEYGLTCSMGSGAGGGIADGFNVKANHGKLVESLARALPVAAARKIPNLITFFGNRRGMSDEEGIANCVEGLNQIKSAAEQHGVTICLELLNSKVDHPDYHGDRSAFGLAVVRAVDSPRVRLLYDIYHMQIMEGDLIRTIRDNREYFAHFHTGGVPGRNELDDTQEINWRTVATAIADLGFDGYFAHEFIPLRDPITSLREAVALCRV